MNHEQPLQAPPVPNPVEELLAQARLGIDRAEALDLLTRQTAILTDALVRIHETVTAASVQAALIHEALRLIRDREEVRP